MTRSLASTQSGFAHTVMSSSQPRTPSSSPGVTVLGIVNMFSQVHSYRNIGSAFRVAAWPYLLRTCLVTACPPRSAPISVMLCTGMDRHRQLALWDPRLSRRLR
ncbi:hypothetical protein BV25DRAFT_1832465 [Artomyces pyxidatus]|uniref:Uncharacterized protein n=1 Tax=Artomyces pyxidatus TaxID=48021 RepID=A0ACB8SIL4_9AGAM|nr:hypothetical protein BV25DRAFT_1832465 [Artomyces pyxidatus]